MGIMFLRDKLMIMIFIGFLLLVGVHVGDSAKEKLGVSYLRCYLLGKRRGLNRDASAGEMEDDQRREKDVADNTAADEGIRVDDDCSAVI